MMDRVVIRPMRCDDVAGADLVGFEALWAAMPRAGETLEQRARRGQSRLTHLLETDPGGAWVAETANQMIWPTAKVDRAAVPARPPDIRAARAEEVALTEPVSRAVRGASHAPDLGLPLADGGELLVLGERGFVLHRGGTVRLLAARDEEAARALLWAALGASPPGATVQVDFLSAGQDWAIEVVLDAGLALSPDGPMFVRGDVGPLRPYIPSGAWL